MADTTSDPARDAELRSRAQHVEWLLCDVDGVLTSGHLLYAAPREPGTSPDVLLEAKSFHVRDGLGLRLAKKSGLKIALLSGRESTAVSYRATELGLDDVMLGSGDKRATLTAFLDRHRTTADRLAVIGDDLPDLPLFAAAQLSFAPADAAAEVQGAADIVLQTGGGQGCVREMIEWILRARGVWDARVDELR